MSISDCSPLVCNFFETGLMVDVSDSKCWVDAAFLLLEGASCGYFIVVNFCCKHVYTTLNLCLYGKENRALFAPYTCTCQRYQAVRGWRQLIHANPSYMISRYVSCVYKSLLLWVIGDCTLVGREWDVSVLPKWVWAKRAQYFYFCCHNCPRNLLASWRRAWYE